MYWEWRWTHPLLSGAWRLNYGHVCAFERVDEAVSDGKPSAWKDVENLLSWHGSPFRVCITFFKMRHGDSFNESDYYYYCYYLGAWCCTCSQYQRCVTFHDRQCFWKLYIFYLCLAGQWLCGWLTPRSKGRQFDSRDYRPLTCSSEQATNVLVSLFTKQCKLVPAS